MAIIDGNYLIGTPTAMFEAKDMLAADLTEVGLELQHTKSHCYIGKDHQTEERERLRGEVPNSILRTVVREPVLEDGKLL